MTQLTLPGFDLPLNIMNPGFSPVFAGGIRDRRAMQTAAMAPGQLMDELAALGGAGDEALDLLGSGDIKGMRARMAASEIIQGGPLIGLGSDRTGGGGVQVLEALEDLAQKDLHPRLLEAGFTPQDIPEGIGREQMNDIMREIDGGTKADKDKALKALKKMKSSYGAKGIPGNVPKAAQDLIEASGLASGKEAQQLGRAIQVQIADDYAVKNAFFEPGRATSAFNQGAGVGTGSRGNPAALRRARSPRPVFPVLSSMENAADMPLFQQAAQQQRAARMAADAAAGLPTGPIPMGRVGAPNVLPVEGAGEFGGLSQLDARIPRVGEGRPLTPGQIREGLVAGSPSPAALGSRASQVAASLNPAAVAAIGTGSFMLEGTPMGAPPPIAGRTGRAQTDADVLKGAGEMQEGEKIGGSKPNQKTGKTPNVSRKDRERLKRINQRMKDLRDYRPNAGAVSRMGLSGSAVGTKIFADTPPEALRRVAVQTVDLEDSRVARGAASKRARTGAEGAFGDTAQRPASPGARAITPIVDDSGVPGGGGGGRGGGGGGGGGGDGVGGGGGGRGRPKRVRLPVGGAPEGSELATLPKNASKASRLARIKDLFSGLRSPGVGLGLLGIGLGGAFLVGDAVRERNRRIREIQDLQFGVGRDATARFAPRTQISLAQQQAQELRGLASLAELPAQITRQEAELASLLGRSGAYAAQQSAVSPQGMMMSQQRVGGLI